MGRVGTDGMKPKPTIGQAWIRRDGKIVTVINTYSCSGDFQVATRDGSQWFYAADLKAPGCSESFDLIEQLDSADQPSRRKIISITRTVHEYGHTLDAVADDGSVWCMVAGHDNGWEQLPELPAKEV